MTVQQFKTRFNRHPQAPPSPPPPGVTLPSPPDESPAHPLPASSGPIPVDPSLFDMPELRV